MEEKLEHGQVFVTDTCHFEHMDRISTSRRRRTFVLDRRVSVMFRDITKLHTGFGVAEVPHNHRELSKISDKRSWNGRLFDLIFCDGQTLPAYESYIADCRCQEEAARLTVSQLILAMQRIKSSGTVIMLLHDVVAYWTIKILSLSDKLPRFSSSNRTRITEGGRRSTLLPRLCRLGIQRQ